MFKRGFLSLPLMIQRRDEERTCLRQRHFSILFFFRRYLLSWSSIPYGGVIFAAWSISKAAFSYFFKSQAGLLSVHTLFESMHECDMLSKEL